MSAENKAQYSELLDHFKVIFPANWPVPLEEPYGESKVKQLAQRFRQKAIGISRITPASSQKTLHHSSISTISFQLALLSVRGGSA